MFLRGPTGALRDPCNESTVSEKMGFSDAKNKHGRSLRAGAGEDPRRRLGHDTRLLSGYPVDEGRRVWVITEADRSSTCLLLPSEY